ncbi:MAG: transcriptional regulator NrdR [Verrucomicrobiota bacterium]|nr:transcriptional regulator NrdR [Verrucomicrobiota bacterium]
MRCPKCAAVEDKVIDSRLSKDGISIRRRRECVVCEYRFTTYEEIERADIRVIKRDGRGEPFDRHKLLAGITKACEKRPISIESLEHAVEALIHDLETHHGREVPSLLIGAKVMQKLHELDEVAYVRYASVYRHFQDIGEFIDEIQSLERKPKPDVAQTDLFQEGTANGTQNGVTGLPGKK